MNKFLRSSISLLLAAFILVGGSGFVIGRMICSHSGYTMYSLHEAKDCCSDTKGNSIKGSCCNISNVFIKTDKFVSQNKIEIPQSFSFIAYAVPVFQIQEFNYDSPNSSLRAPPLRNGNDLLHFLSIQLI